ncbi:hypothetical protein KC315_g12964 [Hortaea werneckii]|uniref:Uncharacterized protein n=1 Tax=Hortaea werneckii EXF-2000 TaxID=1157616 RepID=A0A1Z5TVB9_HORWE|nr:hypothetical protein KC358_g13617 [Hortaea werneckii]OTA39929.1 hypothetical protein BTJ68_00032 [Hortaea werneckii EXF-2000]KAI6808572.1 hypothetical protein KC350_g13269 [Hortaea werneckii]KAI6909731.1 hypothetical protein KC348_g13409 [Hortaea werneckii]KAI6959719.1 hypothetical protein KC321_g13260 [Hortaea werneckii]
MSSAEPELASASTLHPFTQHLQHSFEGDSRIQNATLEAQAELRNALSNLHHALRKLEDHQVQVVANVKLRTAGPVAKESLYSISVNGPSWDDGAFAKQLSVSREGVQSARAIQTASGTVQSPVTASQHHWQDSRVTNKDNAVALPPAKRAIAEVNDASVHSSPFELSQTVPGKTSNASPQRRSNEEFDFLKKWHSEWIKQGGWLYDTLNQAAKIAERNSMSMQGRLTGVQDVIGQSLNAASASMMAELTNLSKLMSHHEHCRKVESGKIQAREEKWRTSSATFHDHARRDRDAAEKRLETELGRQRALLIKIAEANGIDLDDDEIGNRDDREASLGAQLTAEFNMETNNKGDAARRF